MQLVCSRLWDLEKEKPERCFRLATYENQGGAQEIVKGYIREIIGRQLSDQDQQIFFAITRYMVLPKGKKIAVGVDDLVQLVRREDFTEEGQNLIKDKFAKAFDLENPLSLPGLQKRVSMILEALTTSQALVLRRKVHGKQVEYELCHDVLAGILLEWRDWMKYWSAYQLLQRYETRLAKQAMLLGLRARQLGRSTALVSLIYAAACGVLAYFRKTDRPEFMGIAVVFAILGTLQLIFPIPAGRALLLLRDFQLKTMRTLFRVPKPDPKKPKKGRD